MLDGGDTPVGVESTVVACLGGVPRLLRPGGVTRAALRACSVSTRPPRDDADPGRPAGPGMLASHYAPRARVRLDARSVTAGEAVLLFGRGARSGHAQACAVRNLSPAADLAEAAARLFGALRDLDASGAATIAVAPIPSEGLGEAIRDRLARAAAPR